jgi:N utilization substance protein B
MANRHLSRSIVLQSLFEWDFSGDAIEHDIKEILNRNASEFAPGMSDIEFMRNLFESIIAKKPDLDLIIEKAAPDWPIDKISVVDRNILRVGLYELLFANRDEVPAKVAINEAIELAKSYGGENSGKFVNGVLGSVYKEIGEPGKDATPKKKKVKIPDIPYEKMPIQKLGGAVVFARHEGEIYLALVHDVFGHWTLSKGKIPADVDVKEGTVFKIKEEMGLDITIGEVLGNNEYIAADPELGKLRKQVSYFLAESKFDPIKLGTTGGLDDARWFRLADILELNFYNDMLPIITKAINLLSGEKTS